MLHHPKPLLYRNIILYVVPLSVCSPFQTSILLLHDSKGAHLLEQMNNRLKQTAARNVVTAMDFFLPIISNRIKIHMVPVGKGNSHTLLCDSSSPGNSAHVVHTISM